MKNQGFPAREPDLTILLGDNQKILRDTYIEGVPDIVVEVVSPESAERDYEAKYDEYERLGIKEYWLIDPKRKIFDVHQRDSGGTFVRRGTDGEGRVTSGLLLGFALLADFLWHETLPQGDELLALIGQITGMRITIQPLDD